MPGWFPSAQKLSPSPREASLSSDRSEKAFIAARGFTQPSALPSDGHHSSKLKISASFSFQKAKLRSM